MPRYYRRRYTKVVRPKKKWATNIREIIADASPTGSIGVAGIAKVLCANQAETNVTGPISPTPVILKTGNYKVQVDTVIKTTGGYIISAIAYILFIPEGAYIPTNPTSLTADYNNLDALIKRHPEYIMAWKQLGFDEVNVNGNLERVSFSSRLKRNLNSGDQVCFVLLVVDNGGSHITNVNCHGMCQFWTCAN